MCADLRTQQRLGVIISGHEDLHDGDEAPEGIFLVQIQQRDGSEPEGMTRGRDEDGDGRQTPRGQKPGPVLYLFSPWQYPMSGFLQEKAIRTFLSVWMPPALGEE